MSPKQPSLQSLVNTATTQGNPIEALATFLANEEKYEQGKQIDKMRFVGYVLELGYETAKIITSDPYKIAVGGDPERVIPNNDPEQPRKSASSFHPFAGYWCVTHSFEHSSPTDIFRTPQEIDA